MKEINRLVHAASTEPTIIPGFNIFGHEDALAVVRAAESANTPVLLMVNRDAHRVLAVEHWGALLGSIAKQAKVPVGVHLDHCTNQALITKAIQSGFSSVMYDGSSLPLAENIAHSQAIVQIAHQQDVAVEGEIGSVPYIDKPGDRMMLTLPDEAAAMYGQSGLDWLAVSVGNVHRLTDRKVQIDLDRLHSIEAVCPMPLVIHGASGLDNEQLLQLKKSRVAKLNFGTALRMVFGNTLREAFDSHPAEFDRLKLMQDSVERVEETAFEILKSLKP